MKTKTKIEIEKLMNDPFTKIGKDWMLISAKDGDQVNTMTASWGGVGILWNKKVVFAFIRPQRYTKQFIDNAQSFTLSFYDESYKPALTHLGRVSGKDEDKISTVNFTTICEDNIAYFNEASSVIVAKKLYVQQLTQDSFLDPQLANANYPNDDYHYMYIAEIEDAFELN